MCRFDERISSQRTLWPFFIFFRLVLEKQHVHDVGIHATESCRSSVWKIRMCGPRHSSWRQRQASQGGHVPLKSSSCELRSVLSRDFCLKGPKLDFYGLNPCYRTVVIVWHVCLQFRAVLKTCCVYINENYHIIRREIIMSFWAQTRVWQLACVEKSPGFSKSSKNDSKH